MTSRQELREAVANLLKAKSVVAQEIFPYLPSDFGGKSPIVCITGAGSERTRITSRGSKATFHIVAETFTLYSDPNATPPWTPQDAENTMDALEEDIATIVASNPSSEHWTSLMYETTSAVSKVTVGGVAYLYEIIPLVAEVL